MHWLIGLYVFKDGYATEVDCDVSASTWARKAGCFNTVAGCFNTVAALYPSTQ